VPIGNSLPVESVKRATPSTARRWDHYRSEYPGGNPAAEDLLAHLRHPRGSARSPQSRVDPSAGPSYVATASGNTQNASASGAARIAFDQANYECKRDVAQAAQGRSVGASWNNNNVASRNTAAGWILGNLLGGAIADNQMYVDCMRAHG